MIVSEHGRTLAELELPAPPIQPLMVADFNGDGLNDIVLVTSRGVYGYVQVGRRVRIRAGGVLGGGKRGSHGAGAYGCNAQCSSRPRPCLLPNER